MLNKNSFKENLYVYPIVLSAFFFSYIPLIYILNYIGITKNKTYPLFMLFTFIIILFYIYTGKLRVYRESIIMFVLSLFFSVYAAISFSLTINYFNNNQTVIVLSLLNPIYILLATLVAEKQKCILSFIYSLTFVYFIFIIIQWLQGKLEPSSNNTIFIQVFDVVDQEFYQNINNYLGTMCILTLGMFTRRSWLINFLKMTSIILCLFFMLKIGGRSPIVSLSMVFIFWYFILKIKFESMYFMLTIIILVIATYILMLSFDQLIIFMQESDITSINRFSRLFSGSDTSHRGFLFGNALAQLMDSPKNLFFGGGMSSFSIFTKEYNIDLYPHNIILELLAEYGIVGFILFMLPVFYLFILRRDRLGSYIGTDRVNRLFFMLFLYFFIINMFTGSLRNIWFFIFITFLMFPAPNRLYSKTSS